MPLLVIGSSLLLAAPAGAQTTGELLGKVLEDKSGAKVAGAVVSAEGPALQGRQSAQTDAQGSFTIALLPAGVYSVTVSLDGFEDLSQEGIKVSLDRATEVTLRLRRKGSFGETILVFGQRPSVAARSAQTGGIVTREQMELIPYGRDARNFEAVATAIPGVHEDLFGLQINGSGSPESAYLIDGVNVASPAFGTQGTTLFQDFIQEVDVKAGGYQAEYGRSTGGVINAVTKSGGNELHGSIFTHWSPIEANRQRVGRLADAISIQARQRFNFDAGAELGGPVIKDRLWFFAGFAPQVVSLTQDRIISKLTDNGAGKPLLDQSGYAVLTEVGRKGYSDTTTSYQFIGKLTYLIDENQSLALSAFGNPTTRSGLTGPVASDEGGMLIDRVSGGTDASLRYLGKLFNKSMLVEATAAWHHQVDNRNVVDVAGKSAAKLRDTPAILWFQSHNLNEFSTKGTRTYDPTAPDYQQKGAVFDQCAPVAGFDPCPVFRYLSGGAGFLGNASLDRLQGVVKLTNFAEAFGHHQIKYGVDAQRDQYAQDKTYSGGGLYLARPISFGAATVDQFQLFRGYGHQDPNGPGAPEFTAAGANGGLRLAGDVFNNTTTNVSLAAFAQDTWNVLDRFTLDVGLRIERQLMYADPKTQGGDNLPVRGAQIALTNVMPRIGVIYDLGRRGLSKVYASFGRFYEYLPLDLADRALSAETTASFRVSATNCRDPADPRTCAVIPGGSRGGQTYTFSGTQGTEPVDPRLGGQYTDEYQAGLQYQVYRDITVGVGYVHKLLGRVVEDLSTDEGVTFFVSNPGDPGKMGATATTANGQVVPEPPPRRVYDAVTLSIGKVFSEGWLATASYTYSSLRGNYPGLFNSTSTQLNPNTLPEYDLLSLLGNRDGPLPGDVSSAFKLDAGYVYEVGPNFTVNLGGNLRAQQGAPLSYLGAHDVQYGPGAAYILPRGSAGRLPWNWSLNLRASAQRRLARDYTLGFTLDLFNVTNNLAPTAADENYTFDTVLPIINGTKADLKYLGVRPNPNFLQPTAYQLPFSARLGARLSF